MVSFAGISRERMKLKKRPFIIFDKRPFRFLSLSFRLSSCAPSSFHIKTKWPTEFLLLAIIEFAVQFQSETQSEFEFQSQ